MNNQVTDSKSIEPYQDWQVSGVIKSLIEDKDFLQILSSQLYPKLARIIPHLTRSFVKKNFSKNFKSSKTVEEFQRNLAPFVKKMIKSTTKGFTYSGLENLNSKPTLFIANHRDISLDSLFLNYARILEGYKTVRIAVGDNLLDGGFLEKLIRLNKSFVVHREIKGVKETFRKLQYLSSFIDKSIKADNESIWIAQKQGRANDGNDFTDNAVLKMLYLSCKKKMNLEEWLSGVNLTPVSISYEYDPLDVNKAIGWEGWEDVSEKENNQRDLKELTLGISGEKGRVHLHICKVINNCSNNLDVLSHQIDQEIISNYRLWPSNYIAAKELYLLDSQSSPEHEVHDPLFSKRFNRLDLDLKEEVLKIYAAPYVNAKEKARSHI